MPQYNPLYQPFQQGYGVGSNNEFQDHPTPTLQQDNPPAGVSGVQPRGLSNSEGSHYYLIHDSTPPKYNYGGSTIPCSSTGTTSMRQDGSWAETYNISQQGVPMQTPQYHSTITELGPYHNPSFGQTMPQFGATSMLPNQVYSYNNAFTTNVPQMGSRKRENSGNALPGKHGFNSGPTPLKMMKNATQRQTKENGHYDDFSEKLIAYARYNRNTKLIKEIFSDTIMPSPSTFVSSTRLDTLHEQVHLLEERYKTVQLELGTVEDECVERKRKFMESKDEFQAKYDILCRPPVGIKKYSEMFLKHYNQLKAEANRQKWEQTLAWAHQTLETSTTPNSTSLADALNLNMTPAAAECLGRNPDVDVDAIP